MPLWNYLPLMFDCTNHNVMRMLLELVRMILHSMIKTCPFNSKTTRRDHRKFIHSWILLYHTPSYIWDEELQQPNAKQVCDNTMSSQFWMQRGDGSITPLSASPVTPQSCFYCPPHTTSFAFDMNHAAWTVKSVQFFLHLALHTFKVVQESPLSKHFFLK